MPISVVHYIKLIKAWNSWNCADLAGIGIGIGYWYHRTPKYWVLGIVLTLVFTGTSTDQETPK